MSYTRALLKLRADFRNKKMSCIPRLFTTLMMVKTVENSGA